MWWMIPVAFIAGGLFGVIITCVISYDRVMAGKKRWWEE